MSLPAFLPLGQLANFPTLGATGAVFGAVTTQAAANGVVLSANSLRKRFRIQNNSTTKLYVYFGDGASTTVYTAVLAGCTIAGDGTGGVIADTWTGDVSVYSTGTVAATVVEET